MVSSSTTPPKTITSLEAGERLDRFFQKGFPALSYGRVQKALRAGEIKVNGKKVEGSYRLCIGDTLRVPPPFYKSLEESPRVFKKSVDVLSEGDLKDFEDRILYEDTDLIVWNKPFGLSVQGGTKIRKHVDAILDALVVFGRFKAEERPRLVHRLDRDTTGLLLLAKTPKMASFLAQGFAQKKISKVYWALVAGKPEQSKGKIKLPLLKKEVKGQEKIAIDMEEGKHSETHYTVLDAAGDKVSWLELVPFTGRMHQLRVHCASLGAPIVGDGKYGNRGNSLGKDLSKKMCLHAREIKVPFPNGSTKIFKAPLALHMKELFEMFGFSEDVKRQEKRKGY